MINYLNPSWKKILSEEFQKSYFKKLILNLKDENINFNILPEEENYFKAFNLTPFEKIKVVILGQDPYYKKKLANGLSFAVEDKDHFPKSLKNIIKELKSDLKYYKPDEIEIKNWVKQGVFLLNSILTVRENEPGSHKNIGWEKFTDSIIRLISTKKKNIVFILWGKYAESKQRFIDTSKHKIIISSHPSPLSANKGFFGSKPFSKCNDYLYLKGKKPINWLV